MKKSTKKRKDVIKVDGVHFWVNWSKVDTGTSFFIPCVNTNRVLTQVRKQFKKRNWKAKSLVVVENGFFGIRIWRIM